MAKKKRKYGVDDVGFQKTDKALTELESRLSSLYARAEKDMQTKYEKFVEQYKAQDKQMRELVKAEKMTKEEYRKWQQEKVLKSKKMQAQIDSLAEDLMHTDKLAMQMTKGELPSIYVTNYNFQGFKAELEAKASNIEMNSFTIYNADAVARIAKDNPDLLPSLVVPNIDPKVDKAWNKLKINEAVMQSIIQGESIEDAAKRLREVTDMDYNASVRNARTAVIGAQNAGRSDASDRIKRLGVEMIDVWSCTHDARTRETHAMMDGVERGEDGSFEMPNGEKLRYPADPNGSPAEVYNCRCRMNSFLKRVDHSNDKKLYEEFMKENYEEDWEAKKRKTQSKEDAYQKILAEIKSKNKKK